MKYYWIFIFFIPFLGFPQKEKSLKKELKSRFFINVSTVYTPYQLKGFYKQNIINSLGSSAEMGIFITFWDVAFIQTGINKTNYRSYNFRDRKGIYHQVVSRASELTIPFIAGINLDNNKYAIGIGIKKIIRLNESYVYKIYENGNEVYNNKSDYINQHFIQTSLPGFIFVRAEGKIKESFYLRLDYRFFLKEAIFLGLTYRLPW